MEQRAVILVKGRVQGVYFRASTARTAIELGIRGHVENLMDGNVRIVAEGTTENLEKLIEWCGEGPPRAKVESVEFEWLPSKGGFIDFRINRTQRRSD
ncbi:MAG: acylphosphatase [Candidatus Dadabacteria bacterium]|nr:acylphosphatase [Candidatus Dadabacteria bacterium]MYA47820.1 acylphosphatase [Candidatus Dadabacteria bacterium]MYF48133.1 acylphosphatase [Candidatus Dadabacteria bacterium]MYG82555.1 acylphosphatase [Candidatus Dadabacteria bacterium]MYK49878.1 acylphosphatase [Candidatus Dadabacteria bacterium]